jgi:hypothetical protein
VQLVPRVRKAQEVTLALKAKKGQEVTPVFKALLALRVRQEPKEFKVILVHVVKRVTPVLLGKQERKVILVRKVPQGRKVNRVSLELLGKTV